MAQLKNLRHFNESEKQKAIAQITQFITDDFELEEGESAQDISSGVVAESAKDKVVDLFNAKAMVESLVSKSKKVLQEQIN